MDYCFLNNRLLFLLFFCCFFENFRGANAFLGGKSRFGGRPPCSRKPASSTVHLAALDRQAGQSKSGLRHRRVTVRTSVQ